MSTIKELLDQGVYQLAQAHIPQARLDAQVLLGDVLELDRAMLYAYPERSITSEQAARYLAMIARRSQHEPIAYIVGHKAFYGLDFLVDQRVLIPRPETELLVETALKLIKDRLTTGTLPIVADIGTGSGAIPITIAIEEPHLPSIYAADISSAALEVAHQNCERHHVLDRVRLLQGDLVAALPEPVNLLLANLPYVGIEEQESMDSDVYSYEPHLALFGGPHGLDLLERLCDNLQTYKTMQPDGIIMLEIGYLQKDSVTHMFKTRWPAATVTSKKDYAGFDRLLQIIL